MPSTSCHSKQHIDVFALISGAQRFFAARGQKLKENNKRVIGCGVKKLHYSDLLIGNCDRGHRTTTI